MRDFNTVTRNAHPTIVLAHNSVIRNTYLLLSATLIFSAFTAYLSVVTRAQVPNPFLVIMIYGGLLMATSNLRNSPYGLVSIFALTGFLGYTLGPILNSVLYGFSNGPQLVGAALGLTGFVFLGLSGYAISTRQNFNYLGGFLFAAVMVAMVASIANIFLRIEVMQLAIASVFVVVSSGYILMQTSDMINGGEDNYIMATVNLYVSIYNLFISLLQILSMFSSDRRN